MRRCNVCNRQMRLLEIGRSVFQLGAITYPFAHLDGSRNEHPVKRMCTRCARRADRLRGGPAPAPPGQAGEACGMSTAGP
jgi:hypothetical protein